MDKLIPTNVEVGKSQHVANKVEISKFYKSIPEIKKLLDVKTCVAKTAANGFIDPNDNKTNSNNFQYVDIKKDFVFYKGADYITQDLFDAFVNNINNEASWFAINPNYAFKFHAAMVNSAFNVLETKTSLKLFVMNLHNIQMLLETVDKLKSNSNDEIYNTMHDMIRFIHNIDMDPNQRYTILKKWTKNVMGSKIYLDTDLNTPDLFCDFNVSGLIDKFDLHQIRNFLIVYLIGPLCREMGFDGMYIPQVLKYAFVSGVFKSEVILFQSGMQNLKIKTTDKRHWLNWSYPKTDGIDWDYIKENGFILGGGYPTKMKNKDNMMLKWYFRDMTDQPIDHRSDYNDKVIVSFNCHSFKSINASDTQNENVDIMIEWLNKLGADIVCLQENLEGFDVQLNNKMRSAGYGNFVHGTNRSGLSIYSKTRGDGKYTSYDMKKSNTWDSTKRGILTFTTDGMTICNTHLSIGERYIKIEDKKEQNKVIKSNTEFRNDQIKQLVTLCPDWDIIGGDFNEEIKNIKTINKCFVKPENDDLTTTPFNSVDHFFVKDSIVTKSYIVPFTKSDHNMICLIKKHV